MMTIRIDDRDHGDECTGTLTFESRDAFERVVTAIHTAALPVNPPSDHVVFNETDPGVKWFINEDGEAYAYPAHLQEEHFPNDDHVPYSIKATAEDAAAQQMHVQRRNAYHIGVELPSQVSTVESQVLLIVGNPADGFTYSVHPDYDTANAVAEDLGTESWTVDLVVR